MLRYALRRVLWAIPTLLGVTLVVFFVTTLIPDQDAVGFGAAGPADHVRGGGAAREEQRRARFLDLPRFVNARPKDVASRAESAIEHVAKDDAESSAAAKQLVRLGGAALPYVMPRLEALAPEARGRVALALVPVAVRMGVARAEDLARADLAVTFWTRFWEDRALDFTEPAVRRAVDRLVEHGTDLRERDLEAVDTFALPYLIEAMKATQDGVALERLSRLAAHATEQGPTIRADAAPAARRRALAEWQEYWYVHRTDFVVLDGAERVSATLGETRYGKWIMRAASGNLGLSVRDGEPIADKLAMRAPLTLLLTAIAMLASFALAVPLGVAAAWRKGKGFDVATSVVLFALYSLPAFWAAEILRRAFASGIASEDALGASRLVLPVVALAAGSLAMLSRYQRASMLDVVRLDYVRTARAKGVGTMRWLVVHALRNALLPTVTLAGLQLPALLGGAFVVEEVFRVPGLGYETLRAVEAHDTAWLLAVVVLAAVVTTIGLIASDVAYGVLDPRVREALSPDEAQA